MSQPAYTRVGIGDVGRVDAHADGEVSFAYSFWDDSGVEHLDEMSFTIEELQDIIKEANAHKKAYEMYKESGYENSEGYDRTMLFLCGKS